MVGENSRSKTLQRRVLHYWHILDTTAMRWRIPASPRSSCCLNHTIQSMSKHETYMSAWLCAWTGREKLCVLFGCAQFSANAVAIIFWISRFSSLRLNPPRIGCLWWYEILPWLPHTHCHAQKCCSTCCVDSSWKPICQQNSVHVNKSCLIYSVKETEIGFTEWSLLSLNSSLLKCTTAVSA